MTPIAMRKGVCGFDRKAVLAIVLIYAALALATRFANDRKILTARAHGGEKSKDFYLTFIKQSLALFRLGLADASKLAPVLSAIYRKVKQVPGVDKVIFIDVGANVGQTIADFLAAFSSHACLAVKRRVASITSNVYCEDPSKEIFVGLEPVPISFNTFVDTAKISEWDLVNVFPINVSVSNRKGYSNVFVDRGDLQQSSFDSESASSPNSTAVYTTTIDSMLAGDDRILQENSNYRKFFNSIAQRQWIIFLLKIDAQGYDFEVIQGSQQLLMNHRITIVVFEYDIKWFTNGRTARLSTAVAYFAKFRYSCYIITEEMLVPLNGNMWDDHYDTAITWGNVACGVTSNKDFRALLFLMNKFDHF